jgi:hypothetical protein
MDGKGQIQGFADQWVRRNLNTGQPTTEIAEQQAEFLSDMAKQIKKLKEPVIRSLLPEWQGGDDPIQFSWLTKAMGDSRRAGEEGPSRSSPAEASSAIG